MGSRFGARSSVLDGPEWTSRVSSVPLWKGGTGQKQRETRAVSGGR